MRRRAASMVKLLSCSQGHYWESPETPDGGSGPLVFCPTCGGLADDLPLLDLVETPPVAGPPPPAPLPLRDATGRPVVAGYELLDDLGKGPTGLLCFRARQQVVGRIVLLHVVMAREDPGQHIWGSLRSESSALTKLPHPNIIQLLDAGERERQLFYNVLEWIGGPPLTQKMAQGPLPLPEILSLVETLARAVHFAHERSVVHRNLKPASILLQITDKESRPAEDRTLAGFFPRIVDWGLGRRPVEGDVCDLDLQRGLPFYLSPEQVWGRVKDIGPSCDIYALGAILFELLAGQPPCAVPASAEGGRGQVSEVLDRIQTQETPLPSVVAQGKYRSLARSAGDLELICKKCLRKDPRRRYASALELAEDLQRCRTGKPIKAQPGGSKPQRAGLWLRRRLGALFAGLVIVGCLIAVPIAYHLGQDAPAQRSRMEPRLQQEENRRLRLELTEAQQTIRMAQYSRLLSQVQRDLDGTRIRPGLDQLNQVPNDLRHWEWHYLMARAQPQPAQRKLFSFSAPLLALAISPSGQYLVASAGSDPDVPAIANPAKGEVRFWDLLVGREHPTVPLYNGPVRSFSFHPHRDSLSALVRLPTVRLGPNSNQPSSEVVSWNVPLGRDEGRRPLLIAQTCTIQWLPDGQKLLLLDREGDLWQIQGGNVLRIGHSPLALQPFRQDPRSSLPLALTDGQGGLRVAVLTGNGQVVSLLDPRRNYAGTDLRGHTDRITGLAGTPRTNRLASVSRDGTLRIWDATNGREKQVLRGHAGAIQAVVFSKDGKRVITAGQDNTLRVWDPQGGIELLTLPLLESNLSLLALSDDGRILAVGHGQEVSVLGPVR